MPDKFGNPYPWEIQVQPAPTINPAIVPTSVTTGGKIDPTPFVPPVSDIDPNLTNYIANQQLIGSLGKGTTPSITPGPTPIDITGTGTNPFDWTSYFQSIMGKSLNQYGQQQSSAIQAQSAKDLRNKSTGLGRLGLGQGSVVGTF